MPVELQQRILRYVRWQDRQAGLLGKLLLAAGLNAYGYPPDCLGQLTYTAYGKPRLDPKIDFNLSHSGNYVIGAFSADGRVGIDIERIRELALADFSRYMTPAEWEQIRAASDPYDQFFAYWTKKESVMKADGRGLSIPLPNIAIAGETAAIEDARWFLQEIRLDAQYKCYLATDRKDAALRIRQLHF